MTSCGVVTEKRHLTSGRHHVLYEDRLGTMRVLHLDIDKTPREKVVDDIANAMVSYMKQHHDPCLFYMKQVRTSDLDVIDLPIMLQIVQHLMDIGEDTRKRFLASVFQVHEINDLVRFAKHMFCSLQNVTNFEMVVKDEEALEFFSNFI